MRQKTEIQAKEDMTDIDAASALLMLSSGFNQYTNENNNIHTVNKSEKSSPTTSPCSSPPKKRERKNGSTKQRVLKPTLRISENCKEQKLLDLLSEPLEKHKTNRMMQMRMDSSSPENWGSRNTLSPTLDLNQELMAKRGSSMLYTSPGMNGFAMLLKSQSNKYTSSPQQSPSMVATFDEETRKKRHLGNSLADEGASAVLVVAANKPARSPSDSGVSSILDEVHQPNLMLERFKKETTSEEDSISANVQEELAKINEISSFNKEMFTNAKLACLPLEMTFNPKKSRMRKECTTEIDNLERLKNNEASRRSRHKKKLITHMMNISLEFDRVENRHLYMEERRLQDLILELEQKALSSGIDSQIVQTLRSSCGFQ
uniref:BZIP domain-containing protein n=1 Tax=Anopheles culicifacies TaxID=139723 RepID=A0A182LSA9_9DIPT